MSINNIYFIDIETVGRYKSLDLAPESQGNLFLKKFHNEIINDKFYLEMEGDFDGQSIQYGIIAAELYKNKSALYAEFGKIVSVSIGCQTGGKFYMKTVASMNEKHILEQLSIGLEKATVLCAHNGLEFDFPFLSRRYMINGLPIPAPLDVADKKPWDIQLKDTMKMWSGTQWNYKVSLEMLANVFGLPNPKESMTGKSVSGIYYGMFDVESDELPFDKEEAALQQIGKYNAQDVITLANIYSRMKGLPVIDPSTIVYK